MLLWAWRRGSASSRRGTESKSSIGVSPVYCAGTGSISQIRTPRRINLRIALFSIAIGGKGRTQPGRLCLEFGHFQRLTR